MNYPRFLDKKSKGQVFVIIGIVIGIALVLIQTKVSFDTALNRRYGGDSLQKNEIVDNIGNEYRESFKIAVKKNFDDISINGTLTNFTLFMEDGFTSGKIGTFYTFSIYDNSTINVTVGNFLGRRIEDLEISQNLTDDSSSKGSLPNRKVYKEYWSAPDESTDYMVNVTYTDTRTGKRRSKIYHGESGGEGNYASLLYQIELELGSTRMTDESTVQAKPV
jgi:hypothetical protein